MRVSPQEWRGKVSWERRWTTAAELGAMGSQAPIIYKRQRYPTRYQRLAMSGFTASRGSFAPSKLHTVLVANRGEIALRLLRGAKALGLRTVSVYTAEDEGAPHRAVADASVLLPGKETEGKGYLNQDAIVQAALDTRAQAILPGYGFLSENASFASKVEQAGLVFAGPTPTSIKELGLKFHARELAEQAGVPCVPGSGLISDLEHVQSEAQRIGFPVMLKASSGGGGMGLQVVRTAEDLESAYHSVVGRSKSLFGDAACFLEKYVEHARHIEVQVFGNGAGDVVHFGERECSIQRRHQKIIEEAPSQFVSARPGLRERMTRCAVSLAELTRYRSAGTVEFLVDDDTAEFYFLEVNTRIQVEHPVTEIVWDIDLVALMLQQAEYQLQGQVGIPKEALLALQTDAPTGHAIEARVYSENPLRNFAPSPGLLQLVDWKTGPDVRIDSWVCTGTTITPSFDPLLAKVICSGPSRGAAAATLSALLHESRVYGPTNIDFLSAVVDSTQFRSGYTLTSFLTASGFEYKPAAVEVLEHGLSVSVQDGGRPQVGHGVPVSGPMDQLSFRVANAIVGNDEYTEALEITLRGPTLQFHCAAVVALSGAEMEFTIDDEPAEMFTAIAVKAGSVVKVGATVAGGCRAYLAIRGGFPTIPEYLSSKSTCAMLGIGGHQGRDLRMGDVLFLDPNQDVSAGFSLPSALRYNRTLEAFSKSVDTVELYCMRGPFDDDEYITAEGRNTLYSRPMGVTPNVARSGIRLDVAQLRWARSDGGQGGSHPSNLLEFSYCCGGVNWNGDTPVILGVDGPDLGGLLISSTVITSEFRIGQITAGGKVAFIPITYDQASQLRERQDVFVAGIAAAVSRGALASTEPLNMSLGSLQAFDRLPSSVITRLEASPTRPEMRVRACADRGVMVEYGDMKADTATRARIELLLRGIEARKVAGVQFIDPLIRTLMLRFDPRRISQQQVVDLILDVEATLPSAAEAKIPSKVWRLPICFDHPSINAAVDRYKATVRNKAVYLDDKPGTDQREYLSKANGLSGPKDVEDALLSCELLVFGNGFYVGTPILLSKDRRNRMRCQKKNPTRLSTPAGAFGWGGSCGAIYGVESPGGYCLLGRTLPCWRTFGNAPGFAPTQPWLLGSFDTITFYRVSVEKYDAIYASFLAGTWQWDVREVDFDVAQHTAFERETAAEADEYEAKQAICVKACEEEEAVLYQAWRDEEAKKLEAREQASQQAGGDWATDPKAIAITAPMAASVWKAVDVGKQLRKDEPVVILEAMKTEIPCKAPQDLVIKAVVVNVGSAVQPGDVVAYGVPL